MSLKLRRGTDAQRTGITPAEGELIYTTDTKKLYVGDGSTTGGIAVDTSGSGITDLVQDTTPQLGGNLDTNGYRISGSPVTINTDLHIGTDSTDGSVNIIRNSYIGNAGNAFQFAQHHSNTADSSNFTFYRTRGTSTAPTTIVNGDDIIDLVFLGYDGSLSSACASISVTVDGTVSSNLIPGRISFLTHNKSTAGLGGFQENLRLNSDKEVLLDKLVGLTTNSDLTITANGTGQIILDGMRWPASDGSNGQVLTTNGSGSLSWSTVSGGGSSFSRTTVVGSTSSIAVGVSENVNITGASKGYLLYKIQVNEPAWVRIYASDSARTADSSRAEGVDPAPGSGVIAEVITSSTNQVVLISPGTIGFNNESTVNSTIFLRVTNKAYTTAITSTLTIVSLET